MVETPQHPLILNTEVEIVFFHNQMNWDASFDPLWCGQPLPVDEPLSYCTSGRTGYQVLFARGNQDLRERKV